MQRCQSSVTLCKVFERLDHLLLVVIRNCQENNESLFNTAELVINQHYKVIQEIEFGEKLKPSWNQLSAFSFNMAFNLHHKKLDRMLADRLMDVSIATCMKIIKIDPDQATSLESKLKFRAELKYNMKQFEVNI